MIQSRCQRHATTRVPLDRRRLRLRLCRPRLQLAVAALSWNGVDGRPGRRCGCVHLESVGVPARVAGRPAQPADDRSGLVTVRSCRSLPAQLHRVPQPARAAADSVARCRSNVQYRVVDRERPDRADDLRAGATSDDGVTIRSMDRGARVRLVPDSRGENHGAFQPGRRGAARGVPALPDQRRPITIDSRRGVGRPVHSLGRLLRRVLRGLLLDHRDRLPRIATDPGDIRTEAGISPLVLDAGLADSDRRPVWSRGCCSGAVDDSSCLGLLSASGGSIRRCLC